MNSSTKNNSKPDFDESSNNISNIQFDTIMIGEHYCNVNRKGKDIALLCNFGDITPKFDESLGPHLEIQSKKSSTPTIVQLKNSVCNCLLIKDSKSMDDTTYYSTFVENRKQFVDEWLLKKTFAKGYQTPSAVQALVIPELIQRKDALVQFKSGTGKTHAFLCGLLWNFDPADPELQYVFITSTHEVAMQIYDQTKFLLPDTINICLCIGQKKNPNSSGGFKTPIGTSSLNNSRPKSMKEEREEVARAQIIVCTIGKFYDYLCNRKWIRTTEYLKAICVDEFDNIVASRSRSRSSTIISTEDQMANIIKNIEMDTPQGKNNTTQRVFFSATVSQQALEIAHSYFKPYSHAIGEPFIVLLDTEDYTLDGISQYYVPCASFNEKKEILIDLLKQCRIVQGIIFTNRIDTAEDVKCWLNEQSVPINSAVFHGGLPAATRQSIHKDFLDNKTRLLISTDLTARGLDVQGINIVINFDMPDVRETYIHRVGRSGRYGRKGVAISLILTNNRQNEMMKVDGINECSKNSKMEPLPRDLSNLL